MAALAAVWAILGQSLVFWVSAPVGPGQAAMVCGRFADPAAIEIRAGRIADASSRIVQGPPVAPSRMMPARLLRATETALIVVEGNAVHLSDIGLRVGGGANVLYRGNDFSGCRRGVAGELVGEKKLRASKLPLTTIRFGSAPKHGAAINRRPTHRAPSTAQLTKRKSTPGRFRLMR